MSSSQLTFEAVVQDLTLYCGLPSQGWAPPTSCPSRPGTLKTREPGLCPEVCSPQLLLSTGQDRTSSPPGFPGVHPILATGQSHRMAAPAPRPDSHGQNLPLLLVGLHLGPDTREGQEVFLGRLLVPGTCPGSEGPDTGLNPPPLRPSRKRETPRPRSPEKCPVALPCCCPPLSHGAPVTRLAVPFPPFILALHFARVPGIMPGPGLWQRAGQGVPPCGIQPMGSCCWHNQMEPCDLRPKAATRHPPRSPGPRPSLAPCRVPPPHCSPGFLFAC